MIARSRFANTIIRLIQISALSWLFAGCASQLVSVETRPGINVTMLIAEPKTDPKGIFLLFSGGRGFFLDRNRRPYETFPVVPELFAEQGFVAAVIGPPSDQASGYAGGRDFRGSKEHVEDIAKVIEWMSQKWPRKRVFLLGHSSGGVSASHIVATLNDSRIAGIVLAGGAVSTQYRLNVPVEEITTPILFVHHRDDNCSLFQNAWQNQYRFSKSPRVDFVEVVGGNQSRSVNCVGGDLSYGTSFTHAFSGKEHEVVKIVSEWANGNRVPSKLGP